MSNKILAALVIATAAANAGALYAVGLWIKAELTLVEGQQAHVRRALLALGQRR